MQSEKLAVFKILDSYRPNGFRIRVVSAKLKLRKGFFFQGNNL